MCYVQGIRTSFVQYKCSSPVPLSNSALSPLRYKTDKQSKEVSPINTTVCVLDPSTLLGNTENSKNRRRDQNNLQYTTVSLEDFSTHLGGRVDGDEHHVRTLDLGVDVG